MHINIEEALLGALSQYCATYSSFTLMSKLLHYYSEVKCPGSRGRDHEYSALCSTFNAVQWIAQPLLVLVACSQDLVTTKLNQCECRSTDLPTHLCWYRDQLNTEAQLHLLLISTAVAVCWLQVLQHWRVQDLLLDILAVCKSVFCNVLAVRRANLKLNIDSRACAGCQDAGLTVALLPPTPRRVLRQEEVKLLELKHPVISP